MITIKELQELRHGVCKKYTKESIYCNRNRCPYYFEGCLFLRLIVQLMDNEDAK